MLRQWWPTIPQDTFFLDAYTVLCTCVECIGS